jgi:hypothetical protein
MAIFNSKLQQNYQRVDILPFDGFHSHGGTPLSLDVLFHGKSHKEQHAEPFQAAQWNPFLHLLCRGVGVGLASLVTLPAIGAKTGGIKA